MDDTRTLAERTIALLYGALCHLSFACGVALMVWGLHEGLRGSWGGLEGPQAWLVNALLVLQFPLLHTWLLSKQGEPVLTRFAPGRLGRDLCTTTFATFAALQLVLVFALWSPSGVVWWEATGPLRWGLQVAYALSWVAVVKTMGDAGLETQLGFLGWASVARGRSPRHAGFPQEGSFSLCRQPIYAAFALTLWTGPVWTPDRLALALTWTAYCVFGPLAKEARYRERYGQAYVAYQARTPYLIPWPRARA